MKKTKSIIAIILCMLTLFSMVSVSASAVSQSSSLGNEAEDSGDYMYYNGSKMVKSSTTSKEEVKWAQNCLNFCMKFEGLSGTQLSVDGDFGKLSKAATLAFQKAVNKAISNGKLSFTKLAEDGSFGSKTIQAMKKILNDNKRNSLKVTSSNNTTVSTSIENNWLWPTSYRRISCGFADNYYHTSHWHRGIDIPVASGSDIYASKSGTVALVVGDTSSRGRYIVIDHGDGYYSEYQHLKSVSVKKGDKVKQGQVIAKSGATNGTSKGGAAHLHFEIMYLGKSGLGAKYTNYWNSYSKYINTNPKNTDKVFCTKSNSSFKIRQKQNEGVPTAKLVKTNNAASYGVYCYDTNGIHYTFK